LAESKRRSLSDQHSGAHANRSRVSPSFSTLGTTAPSVENPPAEPRIGLQRTSRVRLFLDAWATFRPAIACAGKSADAANRRRLQPLCAFNSIIGDESDPITRIQCGFGVIRPRDANRKAGDGRFVPAFLRHKSFQSILSQRSTHTPTESHHMIGSALRFSGG